MFNNNGNISVIHFLEQMEDLKKYGEKSKIYFFTSDQISIENANSIIFIDMPSEDNAYLIKAISLGIPLYLYVWESIIVNERNFNKNLHQYFEKIFTYDDSVIDNNKYVKVAYSFRLPKNLEIIQKTSNFCCLISGNKFSNHSFELYSERTKIIRWFENNHHEKFHLYGQGWNKKIPAKTIIDRAFNKFPIFNRNKPKCYKGTVENKIETHRDYNFSICFENSSGIDGYITEKIFDVLQSGSIPIYLGAPNISNYIPKNCFIDYRNFDSIGELYDYLINLNEVEIRLFRENIKKLFKGDQLNIFRTKTFAQTIINNIL
jgi:alpha(1,3/1,4) fucosyltransferase